MGVLCQNAARIARFHWLPRFLACLHLLGRNAKRHLTLLGINHDLVTVLYECERSSNVSFWCDMTDNEAVRSARETSVGNQCDFLTKAFAHDGAGGPEHFAHTRSAFRPF